MAIDIFEEIEAFNADPEAYEMIMGGTPEELFPNEIKKLDNWLDNVYAK